MVTKCIRLIVTLFLFSSLTTAIAGGIEYPSAAGFYIEVNGGYSYRNWRDDGLFQNYVTLAQLGIIPGSFSNGQNGLTVGADLGYQVNDFIALETGWYDLPQMRYTVATGNVVHAGNNILVQSWLFYFGGKLMVPIYRQKLFLFGKLAAAYLHNQASYTVALSNVVNGLNLPTSGNFWAPLFAAGVQYDITWSWAINMQYLFVEGNSHTPYGSLPTTLASPDTNLFTIGVAYKFAI